ncbi:MAG: penicillin-binding protein 2 [Balneolaceae bacterium]
MSRNTRQIQKAHTSIRILQVVVVLGFLVMFGRIFQLQIIDHEKYEPLSQQNSIRMDIVNPARGLILDRNGEILVENQPIYSISVTPAQFDIENLPLLSKLLGMEQEAVMERVKLAQEYSWQRPSRLFTEVPFEVFTNIEENIWRLPGIGHQIESKRNYPGGVTASHVMGYLREPTQDQFIQSQNLGSGMLLGDKVGRSGIEMVYEDYLKGDKGTNYLQVNAYGQVLDNYDGGNLNEAPVKGSDLFTTLDSKLQILAEELMVNKEGGLVAMDPNTGEILSLVSAPQYDLRKLSGRIDNDYWQEVNRDSLNPLFNRAISSQQPPGSTLKPFMGLFGLESGLITPNTEIYNSGSYRRGREYLDLADPGDYDLEEALTKSSNTYFFWMMDQIASDGYLNRWAEKMKDFGMGVTNNIDLPFERDGIIPDSTYMNQSFGDRYWGVGDLMSLGVGQGMVSVSPLQMAVAVSSIANGGYKVQPHLVSGIRSSNNSTSYTNPERQKIDWVSPNHLRVVREGMRGVVREGSGRFYANLDNLDIEVAGKTGTAQNPHGEDHGWFIAYAPYDNPTIAIAVLVENAGYGSISAAPIAGLLIEQYINGEISREYVKDYVLNFTPRTPDVEDLQ